MKAEPLLVTMKTGMTSEEQAAAAKRWRQWLKCMSGEHEPHPDYPQEPVPVCAWCRVFYQPHDRMTP